MTLSLANTRLVARIIENNLLIARLKQVDLKDNP